MGMYTKFGFTARIKEEYIQTVTLGLPNQELTSGRWLIEKEWLPDGTLKILMPDEIKNYDHEIEKFMTWITLFVVPSVEPIAAQWYEKWAMPMLYWKK